MNKRYNSTGPFSLDVGAVSGICPAGEAWADRHMAEGDIPVFSCEGACIRGEIARLAANIVGKEKGFARACHAETFTVPYSAMAKWVGTADKAVMIDGCFLKCHGRILAGLIGEDRIAHFDALSRYQKYTDLFEADSAPREEIEAAAQDVAAWVLDSVAKGTEAHPAHRA